MLCAEEQVYGQDFENVGAHRAVGQISAGAADICDLPNKVHAPRRLSVMAKRAIDIVGAVFFFGVFAWVFLLILVGVLVTTGRPAIYRHQRVGLHGRHFGCLKFRTMVVDADRVLVEFLDTSPEAKTEWERTFKLKNDPRITWFGRFLRRTSLDELPQFWNVFVGDMSLVGPRPVVTEELVRYYGTSVKHYASVRPGLTGPWQVGGRNHTAYDVRVKLDAEYATTWTLLGDLKILLKTVAVVILGKGSY
jgi:exopolysaccharide production protein ExoY